MIEFCTTNDLLNPSIMHTELNNTTTALLQMLDKWTQTVDKGHMAGVCLLDMSAAFDVVDHCILKEKMKTYGLGEISPSLLTATLVIEDKVCV